LTTTAFSQVSQPTISTPESSTRSRLMMGGFALLILAIYSCPFCLDARATGRQLPPLFAPDLYLYLNFSNMKPLSPDTTLNPWYGISVSSSTILYKKFGLSFLVFHWFWRAVGSDWFLTVFLWNLVWVLLIFTFGVELFSRLGCDRHPPLLFGSLGLLLLVDLQSLPAVALAWLHFPSFGGFESVTLPYMRSFFPQVAIPLVLLYITLQIKVLGETNSRHWGLMALTQAVALAVFPYAALLMAGITAVVVLVSCCSPKIVVNYKHLILFVIVCGLTDFAYLLSVGTVLDTGGPSRTALLHFDLLLFLHLLKSKTLLLLVGATIAAAVVGDKSRPHVKWTAVASGSTTGLLLVGDAFISPKLLISGHGLYFVHTVLVILLVTMATSILASTKTGPKLLSAVLVVIAGFFVMHGALAARGTYLQFLRFNASQAKVAGLLESAGLGNNDLVIADARFVDSTPCWVPLLSSSAVLFCRNAEFVLAPEQKKNIQQYREAIYLYLTGHDTIWLEKTLSPAGSVEAQRPLSLIQSNTLLEGPHRDAALLEIRDVLSPMLARIEAQDPDTVRFFRQYRTILVIDASERPMFLTSRLGSYLQLTRSERVGDVVLSWYNPL